MPAAGWDLSTRESNLRYIRRTIKPALGVMQVRKVRGPLLDTFYARLMRCGNPRMHRQAVHRTPRGARPQARPRRPPAQVAAGRRPVAGSNPVRATGARRRPALGSRPLAANFGGAAGSLLQGYEDIAQSAAELSVFVSQVLAATGASRVDIVGHPQGGMMPRYYLKFLGGAAKVHTLVGLAPSNHDTTLDGIATLESDLAVLIPGISSGASARFARPARSRSPAQRS